VAPSISYSSASRTAQGRIDRFEDSAQDPNRYILVQRNYAQGRFTTPKSKKSRRVDLSKQLRAALLDLRHGRLLKAMMADKTSIADELVFPSHAGTVIKPDNIPPRYMEPALEKAGIRRFRFHDLLTPSGVC
jgi:integrase